MLVGQADDASFGDGGVGEQGRLNLGGIDVLATRDDQVAAAIRHVEVAFVVTVAQVAGVEPAVAQGGGAGFGIADVAAGDGWAAEQDLAHFAGCRLAPGDVNAQAHRQQGLACRTQLAQGVGGGQGDGLGTALGESVGLDDGHAKGGATL